MTIEEQLAQAERERDSMRLALQDVARWLAWYLDPRTDR